MNVALLSQPQRELRAYLQRVAGDGGTVETPGEASTFVRRLRSAGVLGSTVIAGVAGGYKAGTLYSIIGPDLDVTRGTVKNRVNRAGVLSEVASGVPATDYAGGVLRGTTVEPSAVNLYIGSEDATTFLFGAGVTITPNTGNGADGTVTADNISGASAFAWGASNNNLTRAINVTAGQPRTFSTWIRSKGATQIRIGLRDNSVTGTIQSTLFNITGELVRLSRTQTSNLNAQTGIIIGDADGDFELWGMMFETGSVATSYIKTTGSAQTRNADVITDDLTLPQTSGIFTATLNNRLITGTRTIATLRGASTTWPVELRNNRFGFRDVVQGADTTAGTHRVSVWWSDSGATYRLYVDGALIGTEQTGATPISGTIGTFDYGMNNSTNWLNDALSEIAVISGGTPSQAQTLSTL
jgi:hypothetical protein